MHSKIFDFPMFSNCPHHLQHFEAAGFFLCLYSRPKESRLNEANVMSWSVGTGYLWLSLKQVWGWRSVRQHVCRNWIVALHPAAHLHVWRSELRGARAVYVTEMPYKSSLHLGARQLPLFPIWHLQANIPTLLMTRDSKLHLTHPSKKQKTVETPALHACN